MGDIAASRTPDRVILKNSIVLAGAIKSGKTTVAKELAARLQIPFSSFGDEVRRRAGLVGLDATNRSVLQDLGQLLVDQAAEDFTASVVNSASPQRERGQPIILDGLRHVKILHILYELLADTGLVLIYLEVADEVREVRAATRHVALEELKRAEGHDSESELADLRGVADIVVSTNQDLELLMAEIVRRASAF